MLCTKNYMSFENMCNELLYEKDSLSEEFRRFVAIESIIKTHMDKCKTEGDTQGFQNWSRELREINRELDFISAELDHVMRQYKQLT